MPFAALIELETMNPSDLRNPFAFLSLFLKIAQCVTDVNNAAFKPQSNLFLTSNIATNHLH